MPVTYGLQPLSLFSLAALSMGAADQVRLRNPLTQLEQHGISQMIYGHAPCLWLVKSGVYHATNRGEDECSSAVTRGVTG